MIVNNLFSCDPIKKLKLPLTLDGFGAGWSFARIESEGHLNVIKALHEQNPDLTLKKLVGSDKNGRYALLWMARQVVEK